MPWYGLCNQLNIINNFFRITTHGHSRYMTPDCILLTILPLLVFFLGEPQIWQQHPLLENRGRLDGI